MHIQAAGYPYKGQTKHELKSPQQRREFTHLSLKMFAPELFQKLNHPRAYLTGSIFSFYPEHFPLTSSWSCARKMEITCLRHPSYNAIGWDKECGDPESFHSNFLPGRSPPS